MRYSMLIEWSQDDEAYLVTLPDWEGRVFGPVTHGETYEEAVARGKEALDSLVASAPSRFPPRATTAKCTGQVDRPDSLAR